MELNGGHVLVRALSSLGVDVAFGIPGTHNLEIYRHLVSYGIRHMTPRHEQGAGYAADGYARVSGKPGVVITTTGPAMLNAAAAAGQAYSDSVPLLLISPGMPLAHPALPNGLLHEIRPGALDAVTGYSHRVTSVAEIEIAVARAFTSFRAGRPRPVHIEIPLDLLAATAPMGARPASAPLVPPREVADDLVARAASRLREASRPVVVAGGGARGADVTAVAEAIGAVVVTTANGKGVVDESHPLSIGATLHLPAVQDLLRDADLVLAIGTELAESDFWCEPPVLSNVIRIDVDPAQTLGAALALVGDAAGIAGRLVRELPSRAPKALLDVTAVRAIRDEQAREMGARWLPWLDVLRASTAPDAIFTSDSAMACYRGALACLPVGTEGRYLHPTGFGTLGYALPAAIGALIAVPDRQVVALSGDGGLQFTISELATAVALGRPLPVVVFDNAGYGEIRDQEIEQGIEPVAVDFVTPDLPAIARAYGGHGTAVDSPERLAAALGEALHRSGPTLIVVPERQEGTR